MERGKYVKVNQRMTKLEGNEGLKRKDWRCKLKSEEYYEEFDDLSTRRLRRQKVLCDPLKSCFYACQPSDVLSVGQLHQRNWFDLNESVDN